MVSKYPPQTHIGSLKGALGKTSVLLKKGPYVIPCLFGESLSSKS